MIKQLAFAHNSSRLFLEFYSLTLSLSRFKYYSSSPKRRLLSSRSSSLEIPTIIYNDNHLLVVNKPPGWHSVPNYSNSNNGSYNNNNNNNNNAAGGIISSSSTTNKCLLTYLKNSKLGGGSNKDFLLPLHRIDQPCSGILMLGKTSKAGSRITKLWKKKYVQKEYLVVVSTSKINILQQHSSSSSLSSEESTKISKSTLLDDDNNDDDTSTISHNNNGWYTLEGFMEPRKSKRQRSVKIHPKLSSISESSSSYPSMSSQTSSSPSKSMLRPVSIEWKIINNNNNHYYSILLIKTNDGSRHIIRAILSQVGNCPIEGDLRYNNNNVTAAAAKKPLPDQSVALHAYRLHLDHRYLQLGTLTTYKFEAPIPKTWKNFFGISRDN